MQLHIFSPLHLAEDWRSNFLGFQLSEATSITCDVGMCFSPATFYYPISGRDPQLRLPAFFFSFLMIYLLGLWVFSSFSLSLPLAAKKQRQWKSHERAGNVQNPGLQIVKPQCLQLFLTADLLWRWQTAALLKIKCFSLLCVPFAAETFPLCGQEVFIAGVTTWAGLDERIASLRAGGTVPSLEERGRDSCP